MKLFSRLMTRKPDPEEIVAMDIDGLEERSRKATADDSGGVNHSLDDELYPGVEAAVDQAPEDAYTEQSWDDEDWDDEDWGDDWEEDGPDADGDVRAALVDGIRDAMEDVAAASQSDRDIQNWSEDDEFSRKAAARKEMGAGDEATEDRILQKTNSEMTSIMSSRRRSAMAHLKKAAAATKADRVLSHVVGRDPTADPDEQSPYRDDLAKVVKPRATSRPVSRPVSRTPKIQAAWETAPADDDAGLLAEASQGRVQSREIERTAFEAERQQHLPADLTEDEFTSDGPLVSVTPSDPSDDEDDGEAYGRPAGAAAWSRPIFESDEDVSEEAQAVALATRRASRVRSSLVDAEADDASDDFDALDNNEEPDLPDADWGLGGDDGLAEPENEFADGLDDDFDDDDEVDEWSAPSLDEPVATPDPEPKVAAATDTKPVNLSAVRDGIEELKSRNLSNEEMAQAASKDVDMDMTESRVQGGSAAEGETAPDSIVEVPTPAMGRAGRSAGGRVKTRLLGFQASDAEPDVFDKADKSAASGRSQYPVGWIVVVDGPGIGQAFTLQGGVMQIGRGENQGVRLDFGDTAISRENHAALAYDDETGKFFLGHGGKSNLVRLNGSPVLSTEELSDRDRIRIGETTLMFVALCNEEFIWNTDKSED